jgi:hypothetical protein
MRWSPRTAAVLVIAAASGWFVRGVGTQQQSAVVHRTPAPVVDERVSEDAPEGVVQPLVPLTQSTGDRNIFAYDEPPAIETARRRPAPADVTASRAVTSAPTEPARPPKKFPYRFIGTFGPTDAPIAAFIGDGKVITVRIHQRIDDTYVLRSIGIESAEVQHSDGETLRIGLSAAI